MYIWMLRGVGSVVEEEVVVMGGFVCGELGYMCLVDVG